MLSASELANFLQYNDLDEKIKSLKLKHKIEDRDIEYQNRHLEEDCIFRNYDWNMMYEEDKYCDDKLYIGNLKNNLQKDCSCFNHNHIR